MLPAIIKCPTAAVAALGTCSVQDSAAWSFLFYLKRIILEPTIRAELYSAVHLLCPLPPVEIIHILFFSSVVSLAEDWIFSQSDSFRVSIGLDKAILLRIIS